MANTTRRDSGTAGATAGERSAGGRPAWQWFVGGLAVGIVILVVGGVVVAGPLILMHRNNLPLEKAYGDGAVGIAARLSAGRAQNPLADDSRAIQAGSLAFAGSCSMCHGPAGNGHSVLAAATYPPATVLTSHDAMEKTDAELFWIIKNGLSFTGMPAFGGQYSDQDIWSLVSYLRSIQHPASAAANPAASDPAQRGAAVFVAQGCGSCHTVGSGDSGALALRRGGGETDSAVRRGRRGMPAYSPSQLSDAELSDLDAYLNAAASGAPLGGERGGR